MTDKANLLLLFDRPLEPSFMPKGDAKKAFNVPKKHLTDRYKPISNALENRFGESEKIPLDDIREPNLSNILQLARDDQFTLFLPKHQKIAGELISIFMNASDLGEFQALAVYARDRVNPYLFVYCYCVALLHRADTQGVNPPTLAQIFPDKYFQSKTFQEVRENATILPDGYRKPIEIPLDYTATDLDEEHRLAYFREDVGVNLHHWHWHLVYPTDGADNIVRKDRRGELFFYAHNQIIARYNIERLCNQLNRVEKLNDLQVPIKEGYFPKLDSLVASRSWPARVENQTPSDVNRPYDQVNITIEMMIRWRDRIYDAIHQGYITDANNQRITLDEFNGIDILGNILESSQLSPARNFYGNYHAMGHIILGIIHDPDHRHLENFGVMGDLATVMRDPIFYRWHGHIEDMFQEFKATLPQYTGAQLNYPGITMDSVEIQSQKTQPNVINTFWQQSDLDLSRGMDFQPRGSVFVRVTHLQHQPFVYNIKATNSGNSPRRGTVRIFLAPKFDERGNPWLFRDQRLMFIEMDKFTVNLRPGQNTINRKSSDSTVTIPMERVYRDLDTNRPTGGDALEQFNFCNCGWPSNLLVPKGTADGYNCELFVMISNYDDDHIVGEEPSNVCDDAPAFCGLKDKKYPDRRSMGYPFDRMPRAGVANLPQFLTRNMIVQDCKIKFNNRTVRVRNQ